MDSWCPRADGEWASEREDWWRVRIREAICRAIPSPHVHARSQASPSRSPSSQSVLRQAGGHGTAFGAAAGAGTCLSIVPPPITHQSTNRQTTNRQTSNQSTANARARKQKWKQGKRRYSGRPRHMDTQHLALPKSISRLAQLFRFVSSTRAWHLPIASHQRMGMGVAAR